MRKVRVRSSSLWSDYAGAKSETDEAGKVVNPEAFHQLDSMVFDGLVAEFEDDLLISAGFEVGLYTATTVSSKLMVTDTSTATASVKVRALVDGVEAAPGAVVYGKRTQQLSATLEGAIAGCLSIITNAAGNPQIVLDINCVLPEIIALIQDRGLPIPSCLLRRTSRLDFTR